MDKIKENFHLAQWKYYKENNLHIGRKNSYPFHIYAFEKEKPNDLKTIFSEVEFIKLTCNSEYYTIPVISSDNKLKDFDFDFFIDYYKKSSNDIKKQLLEKFDFYSGTFIQNTYQKFCDEIVHTNEERIALIKSFPITTLKIYNLDLSKLCDYLASYKIEENVIDTFLLNFLKARKNQIKQEGVGLEIKQFLQDKYDLPQLEKYFPFFNLLKADYEEVDIDVFENNHKYTTSSFLNIKSLIQKFSIEKWDSRKYKNHLDALCEGLVKHCKLNNFLVEDYDNMKQIIKISFFHNEDNFNLEMLKTHIIEYFQFLKINPDTVAHKDNIASWIMKNSLEQKLTDEETTVKKLKL